MSVQHTPTQGMATDTQITKINEFVSSDNFKMPLASFLKNITGGRAGCIEELTSAQANDVIGVMRKLVRAKK